MTEKKRKPDTDHKKEWDKKYMYFVGFKLFRAHGSGKDDQEVIDFLEEQAAKE